MSSRGASVSTIRYASYMAGVCVCMGPFTAQAGTVANPICPVETAFFPTTALGERTTPPGSRDWSRRGRPCPEINSRLARRIEGAETERFDRAADRVHDAAKLDNASIAGAFHDTGDGGIDEAAAQSP